MRWSDEKMTLAQILYTTTRLSVAEIGRRTGIPPSTVQSYAKRDGWVRPDPGTVAPVEVSPSHARRSFQASSAARRLAMLERALALAERHLDDAERRIAVPDADIQVREREARFVGTLMTLIQRHRDAEAAIAAGNQGSESGDDAPADDAPVPRTLEAMHQDFARRLAELFGDRDGAEAGDGVAAAPARLAPRRLADPGP